MKKKLQVFISSTYEDLKDERQAAVQAVLDAGHIPAGMELFKSGNESQLVTVKKWIDDSDVYMLILGGRYGSIEPDSGKSYAHVEYEYAIDRKIPVFAVVLSESYLLSKAAKEGQDNIFDKNNKVKYEQFKRFVLSKIIRKAEDEKDIKIAIHTTLQQFLNDYELVGWVKGDVVLKDELNVVKLKKENLKLVKENERLKSQLLPREDLIGGFNYKDLKTLLENMEFDIPKEYTEDGKEARYSALDIFVKQNNSFCIGITNRVENTDLTKYIFSHIASFFIKCGLLEIDKIPGANYRRIQMTQDGMRFSTKLQLEGIVDKKERNQKPSV